MKKAAIFTVTALYLFIASGVFVCAVHCTAAKILDKTTEKRCCIQHTCKGITKKNCCNIHLNFLVKENLQTTAHFNFVTLKVTTITSHFFGLAIPAIIENLVNCAANLKGPPWKTGRAISISSHALLI